MKKKTWLILAAVCILLIGAVSIIIANHPSSSVISEYVLGQFDKIDLGGLLTLMKRVFTDIEFIYDVKYEFLNSGVEDLLE